jgi:hypothetical protein
LDNRKLANPKGVAREVSFSESAIHTIFGLDELGLVVIDEAHELRTGGSKFEGVLHLRDRALFVIALSATPLYTSARVRTNYPNSLLHGLNNDYQLSRTSEILVA